MAKKSPYPTFTVPERERIVAVLKAHDGNYTKAIEYLATEGIKVSHVSLRKWNKDPKYLTPIDPEQIKRTIRESVKSKEVSQEELKQSILVRMFDLVPREKSLNALANALRTLHELTKNDAPQHTGMNLIQTVYQTIIEKSNETSKNRIEGDIQDVTPIDEQ